MVSAITAQRTFFVLMKNPLRKIRSRIYLKQYHLNNTGELATNRDILISEHGDIETFPPTY